MDPQQFIQSGLLETYVLGECSAAERAEVERMVAQHPEVRAELRAVEQAIEQYASASAVAPPNWMKGRILDLVSQDPSATSTPSAASTPPTNTGFLKFAAVALFGLSALLGYLYWQRGITQETQQAQIAVLQKQADDCTRREARNQILEQEVAMLRDHDTRPITIGDDKDSKTYVYHNALRNAIYLDVAGMPAPPHGKYYQAWALMPGHNDPVSLGMVDLTSPGGMQQLRYQAGAIGFAISVEDHPQESKSPAVVAMKGLI